MIPCDQCGRLSEELSVCEQCGCWCGEKPEPYQDHCFTDEDEVGCSRMFMMMFDPRYSLSWGDEGNTSIYPWSFEKPCLD